MKISCNDQRPAAPPERVAPSAHAEASWRAAATADHDAVIAMCLALCAEDPGLGEMTRARIEQTLEVFAREPLRGQAVVLACERGDPIGYAFLVPFYSNELGGVSCEVDELYVRPAYRSAGLGSALFAAIEAGAFGAFAAISLISTPKNLRARQLYERVGFRVVGTTFARPLSSER